MRAELFPDEAEFTPRPAWQVIEAARQRHLTGELSLATAPSTNVYLRDGQVYFAERSTDSGIGVRLLVSGVINRQQLGKGTLLINGIEHLGRLFDRDQSIERQAVELCVETMTEDALVAAADEIVSDYRLTLYRRHPAGIDRWMPNTVQIVTHVVESSHLGDPEATPVMPPVMVPAATSELLEPLRVAPALPNLVPLAPHPTLAREQHAADQLQPTVIERLADHLRVVDPDATPVMGTTQPSMPAAPPAHTIFDAPSVGLAQSAVDAIVTSGLADEVAEAVRRALSAIEAAAQPEVPLSPSDFDPATNPLLERTSAVHAF